MRIDVSNFVLEQFENDKGLVEKFCDKAIFYFSGKINRQNVRIRGSENPRVIQEWLAESEYLLYNVKLQSVRSFLFLLLTTLIGTPYLNLFENRSFAQIEEDSHKFIK